MKGKVAIHHTYGDPSKTFDLWSVFEKPVAGTHVYCCGSKRLMDEVKDMTGHWASSAVHFESFGADTKPHPDDKPFEVELARTGMKVVVLCSGGMDSVTALYWARREHVVVAAVSFDYGAKHNHREIPFAAEQAALRQPPAQARVLKSPRAQAQAARAVPARQCGRTAPPGRRSPPLRHRPGRSPGGGARRVRAGDPVDRPADQSGRRCAGEGTARHARIAQCCLCLAGKNAGCGRARRAAIVANHDPCRRGCHARS